MNEPATPDGPGPGPVAEPGAASAAPPPSPPAPAPPAAAQPSLPARLLGVITSPRATFAGIAARPLWVGALIAYLVVVSVFALVYSLNVDWEGMLREQLENSVLFRAMASLLSEDQLAEAERAQVQVVADLGSGGMALQTTVQTFFSAAIVFHFLLIVFATLFYLMGSVSDLRLGRAYLDGFVCFLVLVGMLILQAIVRGPLGMAGREGLPVQAGVSSVFLVGYLYLLHRSIERQPELRRLAAVYAHAMVVPMIAAVLSILVLLLRAEPVTVGGDMVLSSNLAALSGVTGPGVAYSLLSAFDLFRLWELVAASFGFAAVTRFSFSTAAAITFLPWGFVTMARVALAMLFPAS